MSEDINVIFIIPLDCDSENECSEEMLLAFTACEQHSGGGVKAKWVHESKWNKFDGLSKKDVFVLSEFEGPLFNKLKNSKCLLVGPRCLSCCFMEGTAIPSGPEPVFTIAMKGLVVTASGLTKQQKENVKRKVHWMGGLYNTVLTEETTHLVSDTVLSDKYNKAIERGIPVMKESWVEAVWETSLRLNVNGSSSDFDKHKLPPFANLQVTTSGITKKEKQNIMKLVNENGGVFCGAFQSETTDVVVLTKEGVGSEKYKAALEYGKMCVLPAWVTESAARGVCLPLARYRVAGASTSSPLAEHRLPDMSLNFSRITNARQPSNYVDESRTVDLSTISGGRMKLSQDTKRTSDSSMDKEIVEEFEKLDMSDIKKAGPIFDGFCIWLTGVEGAWRERAASAVSRCGGVRYDAAHARVTHVVAGSRVAAVSARAAAPHAPVLSAAWLVRSVRAGRVLDETEYLMEEAAPITPVKKRPQVEAASPMSRRNLQLLRPPEPVPVPEVPDVPDVPDPRDEIVHHYLSQNVPEPREKTPEPVKPQQPDVTEDLEDEPTEEVEQIFRGMKIEVRGLDEESVSEIGAEVAAAGGQLTLGRGDAGGRVLVPLDWPNADDDCVTVFWIKDCLQQQELLPVEYYHRPVKLPQWEGSSGAGPLAGVVASLSTYSGVERAFLDELAKLLGAKTQLRFCRRNTAQSSASTHLICPTAAGDKYLGAVKWGLPAVRGEWLTACAATGTRVPEGPYLIGDTRAPPLPPTKEDPEITLDKDVSEKDKDKTTKDITSKDKENVIQDKDGMMKDKENAMQPPLRAAPRSSAASREHTPKGKMSNDDEMSPASRYIAMARQGLLGGDSQETPKRLQEIKDDAKQECAVRTPPLEDALSTPNLMGLSPTTRRRLQAVRRGEMPSDPIKTPTDPFSSVATPDSAFGAALRAGDALTPDARKRLWSVVQDLPERPDPPHRQTPLSEIRNRFLAQFNGDVSTPPADHSNMAPRKLHLQDQLDTPPAKIAKVSENQSAGSISSDESVRKSSVNDAALAGVDAQLRRLSAALAARTPQRRTQPLESAPPVAEIDTAPQSQPNTVGWDDTTPEDTRAVTVIDTPPAPPAPHRKFMLSSNVDNREEITAAILHLGGSVSDAAEMDPQATHLLCAAPGRSEKMLGSIAAGKWVLHPAYVARSRVAGKFLPEDEFEWGNPLASCLPALSGGDGALARAAHRWRTARTHSRPPPFAGLRALLHVPQPRARLFARLLRAGGGEAVEDEPPYTDDTISVCFADIKRYPLSDRDTAWLVSQRIPVCPPVLLSSYLIDETPPNPIEHCLPEFRPK
ncbi:DNA topoisomerase 2-binding protein 1 [Aricia agestis]|uniref:DNA topoisomerase 2-binding protein 1 n=1 Tax=Aricia agestis TaxID=91739 RepID=UPI001C209B5C|nr:DNA topoisomerase 2-binding protein 1 [Aricia agestis]